MKNLTCNSNRRAFTIVELLIVIIVIGILASLIIVSYSSVQNNARVASIKNDLSQATKQLETFKAGTSTSDQYPADLATANLKSASGTTYTYTPNASLSAFCLTATNATAGLNYFINSTVKSPVNGTCQITNLVPNPNLEVAANYGFNLAPNGTVSVTPLAAKFGTNGLRFTDVTAGSLAGLGPYEQVTGLSDTKSYTVSAYIRSSAPVTYYIGAERRNSAGTNIGNTISGMYSIPANTWTRLSFLVNPVPTMDRFTLIIYSNPAVLAAGDTIDFDGIMATQEDALQTYADGGSTGWSWNGTANASTSSGTAW